MNRKKLNAWLTFCKERFSLAEHALMIAFFVGGNTAIALHLNQTTFDWLMLIVSYLVTFSFFFRLRCFDEIKDYEFDMQHNPGRPLARGLIQIAEVKKVILALTIFEVTMIGLFAPFAFVFHALAIAYSYLMYREFFIGNLLRPHLTTYAVMHTLVSAFVGLSIAATTSQIATLSTGLIFLGLANWAQFNLFEFARKTFAAAEENPNVDSYSSLFNSYGATLLSLSQLGLGAFAIALIPDFTKVALLILAAALPFMVMAGFYMVRPSLRNAKLFRILASIHLLVFYAVIILWEVL